MQNKLEELYEELSHDLHVELEWSQGVERALADQKGLPDTEAELRQQRDEHQVNLICKSSCDPYPALELLPRASVSTAGESNSTHR